MIWPNSTALLAGPVIKAHGWRAVAVMHPDPAAVGMQGRLRSSDWHDVVTAPADAAVLADLLADAGGVLAGDEAAVPLAENVARRLGLDGNDPRSSWRRRDKGLMADALAAADPPLPHPATVRAATLSTACDAADEMGWPVVVKPPASCASDGFALCENVGELAAAWHATAGQRNLLGGRNDTLIVQAYLPGGQYAVNTVTTGPGCHRVSDVWAERCRLLPGGGMAYDRADLLGPAHPLYARLTAYTRQCLDALGLTWGPGHSEIRLDAAGQPRMIDCAARLPGYYPQSLLAQTLGLSQLEAAVLAVTDPAALAARPLDPPVPGEVLVQVWLIIPVDGVVLDGDVLTQMGNVPGVQGSFGYVEPGPARRTTGLESAIGGWNLSGPAPLVEAGVRRIRALETRLYQSPSLLPR